MSKTPQVQGFKQMGAEGFEPSKAEPSDLQSDPFDHFGTRPESGSGILAVERMILKSRCERQKEFTAEDAEERRGIQFSIHNSLFTIFFPPRSSASSAVKPT